MKRDVYALRPSSRPIVNAIAAVVSLMTVSGCGSIPNADVTYYHAQSKVSFKVVRSVLCDANELPLVATTVTPIVVHAANTSEAHVLPLGKLRGPFVDSDVKFELFEDGRLKAVNATSTGQGEAILKAVSTLASTLVGFQAGKPAPKFPTECAFIAKHGGGKPLTITYEGTIDTAIVSQSQPIPADVSSAFYAHEVASAIGSLCAVVINTGAPGKPVAHTDEHGGALLKARQPGWAHVAVMTAIPGGCKSNPTLWEGRVPVAQLGVDYILPIPKPALFGKQTFAATFLDSGALSSIQYASNSGAAQALGGMNSLLTVAHGETTAQKTAEIKAEADLIAQQQRLIACLADPKSCK